MCISSRPAHFSETKILTLPLANGNHFTAYENKAKNISNGPNCMILPIPGRTRPEWFVDTSKYNKFLNELTQNTETEYLSRGARSKSLSRSFESFTLGQYQVGLCDSLKGVHDYLESLPAHQRPEILNELIGFFADNYKGWSFAVCIFGQHATMDAQPIAYEYTPAEKEYLFYPTMDSHTGRAPQEGRVRRDHTFIYAKGKGLSDFFTQDVPEFIKEHEYYHLDNDNSMGLNGDEFMKIGSGRFETVFKNKLVIGNIPSFKFQF